MNPENIHIYLSLLAPVLGLLCTTAVFLQKFVKNKKLKKILEKTEQITKEIIPCITEAERYSNYTGEEKKSYVMTKLNQLAIEQHLNFDYDKISNKIEDLIELTKKVNYQPRENLEVIHNVIENKIEEKECSAEEQIKKIIEEIRR